MTGNLQSDQQTRSSCFDGGADYKFERETLRETVRPQKRDRQSLLLERLIETQIIPRLFVTSVSDPATGQGRDQFMKSGLAGKIGDFAELVIDRNSDAAATYVADLRARGTRLEAIFQDLMIPTALRLGELWDEDINDFTDVHRGMSHLQLLMHKFGDDFAAEGRQPIANKRALLMPILGEQHAFGISVVSQYFWRDGWRVWGGPPTSNEEIAGLVAGQWFDMVGLSASVLNDPRPLTASINEIRKATLNKDVVILVGGKIFNQFPELVREVGGDATAIDGQQALLISHQKLGLGRSPG